MRFLLRLEFFVDAAKLLLNAIYLMPRGFRLLVIQLRGSGARQSPLRAVHDRHHHFQIRNSSAPVPAGAFSCACRCVLTGGPLRGHRRLQADRGAGAVGAGHSGSGGMADERGGGRAAGPLAAAKRTRDGAA
jgi:hypothetical protein